MKEILCQQPESKDYGNFVNKEDCLSCRQWDDCDQRRQFHFEYSISERIIIALIAACTLGAIVSTILMVLL